MKSKLTIHPAQATILCDLLLLRVARFKELNHSQLPSDQFTFHLKSLELEKLISKTSNGSYELTAVGKEFANRFDTQKNLYEKQAKVSVLLVCTRRLNGHVQFLIQQRLKEPYYGYHGFFGGKITLGETTEQAAKRELCEESGLAPQKMVLMRVKHKMDYSSDGKLLEDKFFFIFLVKNPTGQLIENCEGGKNMWLTQEQILALPNLFDGVSETLTIATKKSLDFLEKKYTVSGF